MKHVLIVENNPPDVSIIQSALSPSYFETSVAPDADTGYQLAIKNLPKLVICNKDLYEVDGKDSLSRLREEPYISNIPFIFLVDENSSRKKKDGYYYGLDYYIRKPFQIIELSKIVKLALDKYETIVKRSEQSLSDLRGSIAFSLPHEFFTPLNGIIGFADILIKEYDSLPRDEAVQMLHFIQKDASRLKKLVENFLNFTQLEMIAKDIDKVSALRKSYFFNPKEVLISLSKEISREWQREDDLILEVEDSSIRMAEGYVRKLVGEVIDNAFKFSEKGSPVIVSTLSNDTSIMISVTDHGRGMTGEQISSIGAYMQFNRKKYDQQGPGLGLITAKKITELHGGEFIIDSLEGESTKVRMIFDN